MKKIEKLLLGLVVLMLASCSGSDLYLGKWMATDTNGSRFEIVFEAKELIVSDTMGMPASYGYSQNTVSINNGVRLYGIKLADGRSLSIVFPISGDTTKGVIQDANNNILYTIGRDEFVSYRDIFEL